MPVYATNKATPKEPLPANVYLARCYSIIYEGHNTFQNKGEMITSNKVRMTFELPNKKKVFKEENGLQPIVLSAEYNLSTHEKSTLRAVLLGWRGHDLSKDEEKSFDVFSMIGKPCMLNVTIDANGYNKITSVMQVMEGLECPAQINPTFLFDFEENFENFDKMPEFLQKKIAESPEYKVKMGLAVDTENQSLQRANDEYEAMGEEVPSVPFEG